MLEKKSHSGGDFLRVAGISVNERTLPAVTPPLNRRSDVPWYLKKGVRRKQQSGSSPVILDKPLVERMYKGQGYCTEEEWKAVEWLFNKLNSRHDRFSTATVIEWMKHESAYFGVCSLEVPFCECDPWIVDTLMQQMGAPRQEYKLWYQSVGVNQQIPYAVTFTYKTREVGIVNQPLY